MTEGGGMEHRHGQVAAALALALLISASPLSGQRGSVGAVGHGEMAHGGFGRGSGNPRGAVTFQGGFHQNCFGCFGHHHFGPHGAHLGFGFHAKHFGVDFGFDSFGDAVVQPNFLQGAFVPFGLSNLHSDFPIQLHHRFHQSFVPFASFVGGTTVVIVHGYVPLGYPAEKAPAGPTQGAPRLILLAFQDHSIYAVTDYWVEGDTIFYITSYGAPNGAPVSALDLDLTIQLNRERGVGFSLDRRKVR